jgi:hypothetical protein
MARKTPESTPDETTPAEKPKRTPRATAPKAPVAKTPAPKPATPRKKPVPKPPTEDEATGKVDPPVAPKPEPDSTIIDDVNGASETNEAGGQTTVSANFGERILDTIFGFGVINAEVIERAASRLGEVVTDFPAYVAEVEAKGRPLREQLFGSMKFDFPTSSDVFEMADDADESTGDNSPVGDAPSEPSNGTETKTEEPVKPAEPAKPKAPAKPAEDEISALERRVRELEQQVDTDYEMEK